MRTIIEFIFGVKSTATVLVKFERAIRDLRAIETRSEANIARLEGKLAEQIAENRRATAVADSISALIDA